MTLVCISSLALTKSSVCKSYSSKNQPFWNHNFRFHKWNRNGNQQQKGAAWQKGLPRFRTEWSGDGNSRVNLFAGVDHEEFVSFTIVTQTTLRLNEEDVSIRMRIACIGLVVCACFATRVYCTERKYRCTKYILPNWNLGDLQHKFDEMVAKNWMFKTCTVKAASGSRQVAFEDNGPFVFFVEGMVGHRLRSHEKCSLLAWITLPDVSQDKKPRIWKQATGGFPASRYV